MRRSLPAVVLSVVTVAAVPASVAVASGQVRAPRTASAPVVRHVPSPPSPDVLRARALRHEVVRLAAESRTTVGSLVGQWQRVALCEVNGDWHMVGPEYSGIGFLNATWARFGGLAYAPVAGLAGRFAQILVGMRVTHGSVPDQYGCQPGGW